MSFDKISDLTRLECIFIFIIFIMYEYNTSHDHRYTAVNLYCINNTRFHFGGRVTQEADGFAFCIPNPRAFARIQTVEHAAAHRNLIDPGVSEMKALLC